MFILFKLWRSKAWWKFFTVFILCISIVGGIIGYFGSKGYFDKHVKVIGHKYCYFYNLNNIDKKVENAMYSENINTASRIYDHYKQLMHPLIRDTENTFIITNDIFTIVGDNLVDVLEYSSDSTLAFIGVKGKNQERPFEYEVKGYVPSFTLHDTLSYVN